MAFEYRQCEVAFCPATIPQTRRTCIIHDNVVNVGLDFDVISDPETGDDAYLYSGVRYKVQASSPTMRLTFIGRFVPGNPLAWRVTFKGEDGATLDVAKDAISYIVAL